MLEETWARFVGTRPNCCFGAAIFAVVEATALGPTLEAKVNAAIIASRGLHDTPSDQFRAAAQSFVLQTAACPGRNATLACVFEIMKRVARSKSTILKIAHLELILRGARASEGGRGDVSA
jgi:hypothetical protein